MCCNYNIHHNKHTTLHIRNAYTIIQVCVGVSFNDARVSVRDNLKWWMNVLLRKPQLIRCVWTIASWKVHTDKITNRNKHRQWTHIRNYIRHEATNTLSAYGNIIRHPLHWSGVFCSITLYDYTCTCEAKSYWPKLGIQLGSEYQSYTLTTEPLDLCGQRNAGISCMWKVDPNNLTLFLNYILYISWWKL